MACQFCFDGHTELAAFRCATCSISYNICKGCYHFFRDAQSSVHSPEIICKNCRIPSEGENSAKKTKRLDDEEDEDKLTKRDKEEDILSESEFEEDLSEDGDVPDRFWDELSLENLATDDFGIVTVNSGSIWDFIDDDNLKSFQFEDPFESNPKSEFFDDGIVLPDLQPPVNDSPSPFGGFTNLLFNIHDNGVYSFETADLNGIQPMMPFDTARSGEWAPQVINTIKKKSLEVGIITWNINHFNTSLPQIKKNVPDRERKLEEAKRKAVEMQQKKKKSIARLFQQHQWLDVMVLQEINQSSLGHLQEALKNAPHLKCVLGRKMTSVSLYDEEAAEERKIKRQKANSQKKKKNNVSKGKEAQKDYLTVDIDGEECRLVERQQEYYPIIYRTDRVEYLGHDAYQGKVKAGEGDELFCHWTKIENQKEYYDCRPIIVHRLKIQNQFVNVAVVHTTPEGQKLGREGEFTQISKFLEFIVNRQDIYWIVAGDFYLDPEASVEANTNTKDRPLESLFKSKVDEIGLKLVVTVSATNQTKLTLQTSNPRNVKLQKRAELLDKIKKNPQQFINYIKRKRKFEGKERILKHLIENPNDAVKFAGLALEYKDPIDSAVRLMGGFNRHFVNKRADFFICTQNFGYSSVGIIKPSGGLLDIDPNHNALNWWSGISDHAPVGAVLTIDGESDKLKAVSRDEALMTRQRWLEMQSTLNKIHRFALEEIFTAVNQLIKILMPYLDNTPLTPQAKLLMAYCCYLNNVLAETRWQELHQKTLFDLSPYSVFISDLTQEQFQEFVDIHVELPEDQTPSQQAQGESVLSILKKTFRSLNSLGYVIENADPTDEGETYSNINPKL